MDLRKFEKNFSNFPACNTTRTPRDVKIRPGSGLGRRRAADAVPVARETRCARGTHGQGGSWPLGGGSAEPEAVVGIGRVPGGGHVSRRPDGDRLGARAAGGAEGSVSRSHWARLGQRPPWRLSARHALKHGTGRRIPNLRRAGDASYPGGPAPNPVGMNLTSATHPKKLGPREARALQTSMTSASLPLSMSSIFLM